MTIIPISVDVKTTSKDFQKGLFGAMAKHFNNTLPKAIKPLQKKTELLISRFLRAQPFYEAIIRGKFSVELGLPQGEGDNRLNTVIDVLAAQTRVEYKKITVRGSRFIGGFTIFIMKTDLNEIIGLSAANIDIIYRDLEWLEWLLTRGDSIIIADYDVEFIPGLGRSGGGIDGESLVVGSPAVDGRTGDGERFSRRIGGQGHFRGGVGGRDFDELGNARCGGRRDQSRDHISHRSRRRGIADAFSVDSEKKLVANFNVRRGRGGYLGEGRGVATPT